MFERKVMTFYVPVTKEHLNSENLSGRKVVPMYISPTTFSVRDGKKMTDTLTKGGYVIQYWGEALPSINVSGTTGSGGIEAITILREVYRNEHNQVREDLIRRMQASQAGIVGSFNRKSTPNDAVQFGSILNEISGGISGNWIEGTKSFVNNIVDSFEQLVNENTKTVVLAPTLAAYAVSVDMHFQGENFRGYFKDFSVSERGNTPGLFDYTFNFAVLKRSGERVNFMPWHRTPRDYSGQPRQASIPDEKERGGLDDGLTYQPTYQTGSMFQSGENVAEAVVSTPPENAISESDVEVGIDRRETVGGE